jgi:hypothetical protein
MNQFLTNFKKKIPVFVPNFKIKRKYSYKKTVRIEPKK